MYSHITVGTNDIARAKSFYDPVRFSLSLPYAPRSAQLEPLDNSCFQP